MMPIPPKVPRMNRHLTDAIVAIDSTLQVASGTSGINLQQTESGTHIDVLDLARVRWVYVVHFEPDANVVLAKDAEWVEDRWLIGPEEMDPSVYRPAPGYTAAHFEHFVIEESQPTEADLACKIVGGYIVPDYRMLLIEPPDPEGVCTDNPQPLTGGDGCASCGDSDA